MTYYLCVGNAEVRLIIILELVEYTDVLHLVKNAVGHPDIPQAEVRHGWGWGDVQCNCLHAQILFVRLSQSRSG